MLAWIFYLPIYNRILLESSIYFKMFCIVTCNDNVITLETI